MKAVLWEAARLALIAAALSFGLGARALAAPPSETEKSDWDALAKTAPATFALCEKAEAALQAGELAQAAALYGQARGKSPANVVPARGACRAALARRLELDARVTCQRAFMLGGTPHDMRNIVAAMMGVTSKPSMSELATAMLLADGAVSNGPNEPWGYLARCDVAQRLGDRAALEVCVADLRRVAPDHEETRRMMALSVAPARPWTWLGRAMLAIGLLATLVHALVRRRRARRDGSGPVALPSAVVAALVAAISLSMMLTCRTAHAEPSKSGDRLSDFPIDDAHPDKSIPSLEAQTKNPLEFGYLLQDLLTKAERAMKQKDYKAAARYYAALSDAVPSRSYAFGMACEAHEAAGDHARALTACHEALSREGVTIADYSHFVVVALAQKEPLTAGQTKELREIIDHLAKEPGGAVVAERLRCDVALRVHDVPALEACTSALVKAVPNDPKTISFQWALAIARHDHGEARDLISRARKAGVPQEGLAKMEEATEREAGTHLLRLGLLGLAALLIGALAVMASRKISAARRASASQQPA